MRPARWPRFWAWLLPIRPLAPLSTMDSGMDLHVAVLSRECQAALDQVTRDMEQLAARWAAAKPKDAP